MQEELASRKADVGHLRNLTQDQKGQIEHLQRTLDATSNQVRLSVCATSNAQHSA